MTAPKDTDRWEIGMDGRSRPVRVRAERRCDVANVQTLVADAFGGAKVADLLAAMRTDHCWLGLSFVAEELGPSPSVLGHVCYTRGWVDAPDRLVEVLVLSPLAVRPDAQRQGVGTALLAGSVAQLREQRPEPLVFLEGDPAYYRDRGFTGAGSRGFVRPSQRIPEPAFQLLALRDDASDITGPLVYPDVFWRHDAVGLR